MKNKNLLLRVLLCCLFFLPFIIQTQAQTASETNGIELLQPANEVTPLAFEYHQTPKIAYGRNGRNPFATFSPEQLVILSSYGYPKFLSHGIHLVEKDILAFKEARKNWDNANEYRKDEIYEALGITK